MSDPSLKCRHPQYKTPNPHTISCNLDQHTHFIIYTEQNTYSLRPEILVGEMDVSRRILVLDTSIFMHFLDKYFRTERVVHTGHSIGEFITHAIGLAKLGIFY